MAVFSTNQNRHLFIAKALGISSHAPSLTNVGDIGVKSVGEGNDKAIFFEYKGPAGIIKSDYIPLKNLDYVKAVKASSMITKLQEVEVTLDSTVNSGAPVAGQDYVLRIAFKQFYGMSDNDIYIKDAAVHATAADDNAYKLFTKMKAALDLAFSREVGATKTTNPYLTFAVSGSGSSAKLVITAKEQDWVRGTMPFENLRFEVYPTTIYTGGDDVIWGTVTDVTASNTTVGTDAVGNGKQICDLEYFCMGERGDQYRMAGWPNIIPTTYLADPTLQYNVLEFHYAFTDTGVSSYRSEKDLTIAVPLSDDSESETTIYDTINDIIDEVEYQSGLTIAGLSD